MPDGTVTRESSSAECLVASWASPSDSARLEAASEGSCHIRKSCTGVTASMRETSNKKAEGSGLGLCKSHTNPERASGTLLLLPSFLSFFLFFLPLFFQILFFPLSFLVTTPAPTKARKNIVSSQHRRRCHAPAPRPHRFASRKSQIPKSASL